MLKLIYFFFMAVVFSSCQSTQPPKNRVPAALPQGAVQITNSGFNEQAIFSPSDDRLLFISSQRYTHSNQQVYEYDFFQNSLRRVTFQDGNTSFPSYASNEEILYSSSTDEIKETPLENGFDKESILGYEVYFSDLYGNNIQRLTYRPGPDLGATVNLANKDMSVFYLSYSETESTISSFNFTSQKSQTYYASKNKKIRNLVVQNSNKAYFLQESENKKYQLRGINLKNRKIIYESDIENIVDLSRGPGENILLLSIQDSTSQKIKIIALDPTENCEMPIETLSGEVTGVRISHKSPYKLVFAVSNKQQLKNLYTMPVSEELLTCKKP